MPVKSSSPTVIEVPPLDLKTARLTLIGDTPLISHRFAEKARKEILAKQMKKAKQGREAKDPEADFMGSLHEIPGQSGAYGFPASAFKQAAVRAAKSVPGMTMTDTRGYFHVLTDPTHNNLVPLRYGDLRNVEDVVRLGGPGAPADIRYRGYFYNWEVDLDIQYNASLISAEQIAHLFDIAGFSVGVGDWRPERDGSFGRFHVKKEDE
jgi:hypothetical protein